MSANQSASLHSLMTPEEAAEYLRLSPKTLANMRTAGRGPRFVKLGHIRYRMADLLEYVERSAASSTSEVQNAPR